MAKDVKPTRKNLMAINDRIELSERGHDTLEKKRDGLIMEFMDILDQATGQEIPREEIVIHYQPIVAMAKEAVNVAFETTLAEGLRFERRVFYATFATADRREGMSAFAEKRSPNFTQR